MKERAIAAATDRRYNFMTMATASRNKIEKLFISPGHKKTLPTLRRKPSSAFIRTARRRAPVVE